MKMFRGEDISLEIRQKTLVKYEDFIEINDFTSDLTYKRAFEHELREFLDKFIEYSDSIIILNRNLMDSYGEVDYRSAKNMFAQFKRCFPSRVVESEEVKGLDESHVHRYMIEKIGSFRENRLDKWNKYNKGK